MFSKKSLDKGFRKTSVLLAFHTSLRSVEKRREKKIYIYILLYLKNSRTTLFRISKAFLFHEEIVLPVQWHLFYPYHGLHKFFSLLPRLFIPPSPLSKYMTNSSILYNEQLEWYGFLFFFNSIKRCINYFFFLIMFRIYLIEQNLLFFALKS